MIDIENRIYTGTVEALQEANPRVKVSSVFINSPTEYPFASMEEIANACYTRSQDDSSSERHAVLGYELNIYTVGTTRKTDAKRLAKAGDEYLLGLGFTRISKTALSVDSKTFRIVLRYEGVSDPDGNIYRR